MILKNCIINKNLCSRDLTRDTTVSLDQIIKHIHTYIKGKYLKYLKIILAHIILRLLEYNSQQVEITDKFLAA